MTAKTPPRKSAARAGKPRKGKAAAAADAGFVDPDISTWESAWEQANWEKLAELAQTSLEEHPRREKLALLAMAGLSQIGQLDAARKHLRQALAWGCKPGRAAVILSSGTFNSLGRAASLLEEEAAASDYFSEALNTASAGVSTTQAALRNIQEKAALGLLPEATKLLSSTTTAARAAGYLSSHEARILSTQQELLNGALALAQRRGQLRPYASGKEGFEQRATSQLGQDLWVLEQTGHKRGGFFVEFGASDGVLLSNSYLLETEFGWSGICAEPNPVFFKKLRANRNCVVSDACIGGETGKKVEFLLADEYGGFLEHANSDLNASRRKAYIDAAWVVELTTISLEDFLENHNAPRSIDYLSIDTEGSEYDILQNFPFDKWDIRLITVEHNFTPMREQLRDLLEGHGYTRIEKQWDDWYSKGNS